MIFALTVCGWGGRHSPSSMWSVLFYISHFCGISSWDIIVCFFLVVLCFLDFCFSLLYIDVCIFEVETCSSPCRLALSGKAHPGFWKGCLACSGARLAAGVLRQAGLVPVFLRDEQRSEINCCLGWEEDSQGWVHGGNNIRAGLWKIRRCPCKEGGGGWRNGIW